MNEGNTTMAKILKLFSDKTPSSTAAAPVRRKRGTPASENRSALLAKVHLGKKQLGMSDEQWCALLADRWDVESSGALDARRLSELVIHLVSLGAVFTRGSARARKGRACRKDIPAALEHAPYARDRYMKKIEALLAEKGRAEGTHMPWGYAVGILKRLTGGAVKSLDQADEMLLAKVIAALTYDARRKGRYAGTWGE